MLEWNTMEKITIKLTRGEKPSTTTSINRKKIKELDFCYICKNEYNKNKLEAEHVIPVIIGGPVYEIKPCCFSCHSKKSKVDSQIINFFKKTGILKKVMINEYETTLQLNELHNIYTELYTIVTKFSQISQT